MKLKDKVVIVTGWAKWIWRAIVLGLIKILSKSCDKLFLRW